MLTYEALIEQAKLRNMPQDKTRGILREYIQILILGQIYRIDAGKDLLFTGGTYLRLVHGLKRFSEDLDFNTSRVDKRIFEDLCKGLVVELNRLGLKSEISFAHWDNILVGQLNFPEVERFYGISSRYTRAGGMMIKIETNRLQWKIPQETEVISGYGETYPCLCTDKGYLFADKIDALVKKGMVRHLYDIIFMLSQKYPVNEQTMKKLGYKKDPFDIILERVNDFTAADLKKQAEILRPFLFDSQDADLIANAATIVKKLIEKY